MPVAAAGEESTISASAGSSHSRPAGAGVLTHPVKSLLDILGQPEHVVNVAYPDVIIMHLGRGGYHTVILG